ncbi:ankyrin repeat domain-containing protein [Criblamydia sequanensis]|uniref:Ankyrin repeat-containing protein n=1 Tax=Candidatus Criblamydia sequanensis CRIB-18 TaxID=1437425 RepID=A0A090CYN0_9BACT|nr:ankyrin repeat domain-containing protein [Criblamydia sequanensis]CDR33596.1 Ankyrin repeat-containing protein [Criblamydia sequanensis CRIB-18]
MQSLHSNSVNKFLSLATLESQEIIPLIHEIAVKEPGVLLLDRIAKIGRRFTIVPSEETVTFCNLNLIKIETDRPYFYVARIDGEKFFVEAPRYVRLVHEFIHLMHAYEDSEAEKRRGERHTDDGTDNEEERLTIFGINNEEIDLCSENSFLALEGLPLRIDHDGPASQPPTLIDVIKVGALGSLKEILKDDPSKINFASYCHTAQATVSLLSAAAYHNQIEVIDFLLENGVDIHTADEIGGPIIAALKNDHKELALSLIQRGLDTTLRDSQGMSALDLLNSRPTARFDTRSKPIIKLLLES